MSAWAYPHGDPSLVLWTMAYRDWGLGWPHGAQIAELGCAETDWLERMHQQNPDVELTGVDVRLDRDNNGWHQVIATATDPTLFPPASLDVVVLLGALEHFGLGFYGDPVDEEGDTVTVQNVYRWLKPGGWVFFDVPSNPTSYVTENRHFRVYAPESLQVRLLGPAGLLERRRGYTSADPLVSGWCDAPRVPAYPYHYAVVVAEKPA